MRFGQIGMVLLLSTATACADNTPDEHSDEPVGDIARITIGPTGGVAQSADGALTLTVPKGALESAQELTIQEVDSALPQQAGKMYRLSPEGLRFTKPVSLTLQYEADVLVGSTAQLLRTVYRDAAGNWHMYKNVEVDERSRAVTVATDHFSDWSLIMGAQILPLEATVKLGESLDLHVVSCLTPHEERDGVVSVEFGFDCTSERSLNAFVLNWAVDGEIGGNDTTGIVRSDDDLFTGYAVFTAPRAQLPAQNPTAISVEIRDYLTPLFGTQTLVSNIRMRDDSRVWHGTIRYTASGTSSIEGQSGFTGSETHTFSATSEYTVTGVTERDGPSTELTLHQVSDVSYEKDGAMRKEVYEICQAGGPVILRYLSEYSIGSWLLGHVDTDIPGRVYVDDENGDYNISVEGVDIPLQGQEVKVDKWTHYCSGETLDNSGTQALASEENSGDSFFEGTLDPNQPNLLSGSYEKTLRDEYETKVRVSWELTRSASE